MEINFIDFVYGIIIAGSVALLGWVLINIISHKSKIQDLYSLSNVIISKMDESNANLKDSNEKLHKDFIEMKSDIKQDIESLRNQISIFARNEIDELKEIAKKK